MPLFERCSCRRIIIVAAFLVLCAACAGLGFLLHARHLTATMRLGSHFSVERTIEGSMGQEISLDFVPPMDHYYDVSLLFPKRVGFPESKGTFAVECSIYRDGKLFSAGAAPPWSIRTSSVEGTREFLSMFPGRIGTSYHITLNVQKAAEDLDLKGTRLIVAYHRQIMSEREWDALITGGIGESLWLAAYGVFVAAAIRIALNWREAADQRAFLAGLPPP